MTVSIIQYINGLGMQWSVLAENGTLIDEHPVGLYPGAQVLCLFPIVGVELEFNLDDQILKSVHVTVKESEIRGLPYQGVLPSDLENARDKVEVRARLGAPVEQAGPVKLPKPLGTVGGWDAFRYVMADGEVIMLTVRYTLGDGVESFIFEKGRNL